MREEMKAGDLVTYREEEYSKSHGIGLIVRTSPMYAFVKWSGILPGYAFIANKKQLELVSESR